MNEAFKIIKVGESRPTWSTNTVQGYLHHRSICIGAISDALARFNNHSDIRAWELIEEAYKEMQNMKKWEAYSNESAGLLEQCANRIKAMQSGVGFTDNSPGLVELALKAAYGKIPE